MATIYTAINGTIDPLVARIYADGIDVYDGFLENGVFTPPHPLRSCTTFQWEYNDRINGWRDIEGAINDTFQVDTSAVANSGDYRCLIRIGEGDDCMEYTDVRTISIIRCGDSTVPSFPQAGGTQTVSVDFPHYEAPNVTFVSPDWITETHILCAQQMANVCEEVIELTAAATPGNFARNGYFDVQVGEFLCSFALQQVYAAAPPAPDPPADAATPPPAGNLLVSVQNPEVEVGSTTTVIASTYILRDDGTFDPSIMVSDVTWTITDETGATVTDFTVVQAPLIPWIVATINVDTSVVATKFYNITATINGVSAMRTSDNVSVVDRPVVEANGVVSGDTFLRAVSRTLAIGGANDAPRLDPVRSSVSGTFTVEAGTANVRFTFSDRNGLLQRYPYTGNAMIEYTISGPAIRNGSFTETISLAAGEAPGLDFSLIDPSTWPMLNEVERTAADFTDGGVLTRGTYNVSVRVIDPGEQMRTAQGGTRLWNITFAPGGGYLVTPIFNFFSL